MEASWSILFTVLTPKNIWLETKKILSGKSTAKVSFLRLVRVTKSHVSTGVSITVVVHYGL